jgi:hypothetical protein
MSHGVPVSDRPARLHVETWQHELVRPASHDGLDGDPTPLALDAVSIVPTYVSDATTAPRAA